MPLTSGPCQETSCTAITLNPESNFTRREKNHSWFHWTTVTSPELPMQTWILRMDDYWNIDGSRDLSDSCGPVRDRQSGLRHPGPIIYGQNSGEEWQGMLRWGEKQKWAIEKTKARLCWKITRNLFHWSEDKEFKETIRNAWNFGNTNGSRHALQDMREKQAWRDP